jgi:hypothetical protein
MRERAIHLYLRALRSDKRKFEKEFLLSGGFVFDYSFTRIFGGLDAGLVKFERTNLTKMS